MSHSRACFAGDHSSGNKAANAQFTQNTTRLIRTARSKLSEPEPEQEPEPGSQRIHHNNPDELLTKTQRAFASAAAWACRPAAKS